MSKEFGTRPLERAVLFMFGVFYGTHLAKHGSQLNTDAVPVVFDGGDFDEAAGDLGFATETAWFLLELKRSDVDLKSERSKLRVVRFLEKIGVDVGAGDSDQQKLLKKARTAHWLAYGSISPQGRSRPVTGVEVKTYIEHFRPKYFGRSAIRIETIGSFLSSYIFVENPVGMTAHELARYVMLLGAGDEPNGPIKPVPKTGPANRFDFHNAAKSEAPRKSFLQFLIEKFGPRLAARSKDPEIGAAVDEVEQSLVLARRGSMEFYVGTLGSFKAAQAKKKSSKHTRTMTA